MRPAGDHTVAGEHPARVRIARGVYFPTWGAEGSRHRHHPNKFLWGGTTTRGAVTGGWLGLIAAVVMMALGPAVWVKTLGHASPIFPYDNPALFSMTLAFVTIYIVSKLDRSAPADAERAAFDAQFVRSETGIGAEVSASH